MRCFTGSIRMKPLCWPSRICTDAQVTGSDGHEGTGSQRWRGSAQAEGEVVRGMSRRNTAGGWSAAQLGDVCDITMGQSPSGGTYNSEGRGSPLLNGPTEFGTFSPTAVQWTSSPTKHCEPGDVLLCVRGATTGRKNIADRPYCIGRGLAALRAKEDRIVQDYLWFALDVVVHRLLGESAGSTFPNLPGDKLAAVSIPLPPLATQRHIAAQLKEQLAEVDRARTAVQAQVDATKALPAASLRTAFDESSDGLQVPLGDILKLRKDVVHPRDRPRGHATFVGLEHVESGTGKRLGAVELELEKLTGRKPRFFTGDIVYGYLRPYLNKVWLADFDGLCSVDQYVYTIDRHHADAEFVTWYMRSTHYLSRAPIGITPGQLPRIRTQEVAAVSIPLPPLRTQRHIAARLRAEIAAATALRTALESKLATLDRLPSALLRQVFGEMKQAQEPTSPT